jgi:deoxyadenosine/deoxycytidine kinase
MENKSFIILIDGPMGSGKTTIAQILHSKLKRTAYIGLDRVKRFISDFKKNPIDNEISRNVVLAMTSEYLKRGINVIIEQGMREDYIKLLKKIATKNKAQCFIYQLDAPKELLQKRVFERTKLANRPQISKARIERNYKIHLNSKYKHTKVFDSEKLSTEVIAKDILKEVKQNK